MFAHDTKYPGIKKIDGKCGFYFYSSADDKTNPKRESGIHDRHAIQVIELFEERCGDSSENVGEQIVEMEKRGAIKVQTDKGVKFFHIRRKAGSHVDLEIVQ